MLSFLDFNPTSFNAEFIDDFLAAVINSDATSGRAFWLAMSEEITIKGIIKIAGREYAKNGTRVYVHIIVGRKNPANVPNDFDADKILCITAETVEAAFVAALNLNIRFD